MFIELGRHLQQRAGHRDARRDRAERDRRRACQRAGVEAPPARRRLPWSRSANRPHRATLADSTLSAGGGSRDDFVLLRLPSERPMDSSALRHPQRGRGQRRFHALPGRRLCVPGSSPPRSARSGRATVVVTDRAERLTFTPRGTPSARARLGSAWPARAGSSRSAIGSPRVGPRLTIATGRRARPPAARSGSPRTRPATSRRPAAPRPDRTAPTPRRSVGAHALAEEHDVRLERAVAAIAGDDPKAGDRVVGKSASPSGAAIARRALEPAGVRGEQPVLQLAARPDARRSRGSGPRPARRAARRPARCPPRVQAVDVLGDDAGQRAGALERGERAVGRRSAAAARSAPTRPRARPVAAADLRLPTNSRCWIGARGRGGPGRGSRDARLGRCSRRP